LDKQSAPFVRDEGAWNVIRRETRMVDGCRSGTWSFGNGKAVFGRVKVRVETCVDMSEI